jgi:orotate phosphoribosyltransferase
VGRSPARAAETGRRSTVARETTDAREQSVHGPEGPVAQARLARQIGEVATLTGDFTLRSGTSSRRYFDTYLLQAEPRLLGEISRVLVALLPARTEMLAGLELGGIALVTMCSSIAQLPARFVRKQANQYGTARLIEGGPVGGTRVTVIEDIVSGGSAALAACRALEQAGAHVSAVVCMIDREEGAADALAGLGIEIRAAFTASQIEGDDWQAILDG